MTKALDFQTIIMTLERFWAEKGCLIWQPYHTEVGAGTMNPATSLRVLGPEPWDVGYVEPSIRPDDGRYGENPNRFYQHIQYQVILKPDPGNPQEIYLQSLEALGIDPRVHDIRFVEDNWASPLIGAWGLGWEVWLNGLEITQFTYFQQSGGQTLEPVSVELTYGMERIAMALQGVRDFRNIRWNADLTYGDVLLQNEQESSKYAFELADVDRLREMYELYEQEAETALEHAQVLPAHDYVLKCSHTFNLLDTRGAVGVTERQAFFHRMRDLSRRVADAYVAQREELGFPMMAQETPESVVVEVPEIDSGSLPKEPAPFLLEIGTEELPADDVEDALAQLQESVPALLKELRLEYDAIQIKATPRRLVACVEGLAPRQADLEELVKGPPAERAFAEDGSPTRAAEGFARSKGVTVDDLEIREMDGGSYVVAVARETGQPAAQVLSEALPDLIADLHFRKAMRWNSDVAFSRPIRWLMALHGGSLVPFAYAGLVSQPVTRGLRFLDPVELPVETPAEYFSTLEDQGIILGQDERKADIQRQIDALAAEVGGEVPDDPDLMTEVTHLVEAPTALRGEFDPAHLDLPREVLISVMKKHQRYFPVVRDGELLPYYITVANKPPRDDAAEAYELITEGNGDVIRARFTDAGYFVREDTEKKLEAYIPSLELLTFQADLGSMRDKTERIQALVEDLAPLLDLTEAELEITHRAAELCKADLATQMVVDMTSLQGVMGYHYALQSGEMEDVAVAIREHYLPTSSGDPAPETKPGLAVGLADRLDSLVGLFAAGLEPTGNKDPFAQRRAALGLVGNLIAWEMDFDLRSGIDAAADQMPIPVTDGAKEDCLTFIVERLRHYLLDEEGYSYHVVDAVLAAQGHNPASAAQAVDELEGWIQQEDWEETLDAFARCVRILRGVEEEYAVKAEHFEEDIEREFYQALQRAEAQERQPGSADDFLSAFFPLKPYITRFFDSVMVNAEDEDLRKNRLALLQRVAALSEGVAVLSRLEGF
jgi:glycyl-tRNA synthetase